MVCLTIADLPTLLTDTISLVPFCLRVEWTPFIHYQTKSKSLSIQANFFSLSTSVRKLYWEHMVRIYEVQNT